MLRTESKLFTSSYLFIYLFIHSLIPLPIYFYLQIDEAVFACERFAIDHLRNQNCVGYYKLAETLGLEQLKLKTMEYMEWNFSQIVNEDDFVKLSAHQITSLLASNSLKVRKEDKVYEAAWKWYKHDPEKRLEEELMIKFNEWAMQVEAETVK